MHMVTEDVIENMLGGYPIKGYSDLQARINRVQDLAEKAGDQPPLSRQIVAVIVEQWERDNKQV